MSRLRFYSIILLFALPFFTRAQPYFSPESTPETFRPFVLHQPITYFDVLVNRYSGSQISAPDDFYRTGFTAYHHYLFRPVNYPPLDTNKARSRVHLMLGTERDQLLFIEHQQNLGKGFKGGLHYHSLVSPGFLKNQLAKQKGFGMFLGVEKRRYSALLDFKDARVTANENGGIIDTLFIETPARSDLEVIPVNLNNASVIHRRQVLSLTQSFLITNSVHPLRVHLDGQISREGRSYRETDPVSAFYPQVIDTIQTYDTTFANIGTISPALSYHLLNDSLHKLKLKAGINTRYASERISERRREFNWLEYFWSARFESFRLGTFYLEGKHGAGDFASGNYRLNAGYTYSGSTKYFHSFTLKATAIQTEVAVTDQYYGSNHFNWDNNYLDEQFNRLSLETELMRDHLFFSAATTTFSNKIVFNAEGLPSQLSGNRNTSELTLTGNVSAGKVGFNAYALYRPGIMQEYPQPEAEGYIRIAYRNRFFKEALNAEGGVSSFITSQFNGPYYDPATGRYRYEPTEKIGNIPVINLFVNLRIRTAVISVMAENFMHGWWGEPYYSGPRNPAPPRMLRISVNWLMAN
jgi:hypothetical protein